MTASASAQTGPRKPTPRPTVWRLVAAKYVDLLLSGFVAWILCHVFDWRPYWPTMGLFFWVAQALWCRERLRPTAGEHSLGIRYLTSSSSQVVADIQVLHPKLTLNGPLLAAGVGDLTLALFLFSGWTFLDGAVLLGQRLGPFASLIHWVLAGSAFFTAASHLLGGSRQALWSVPLFHGAFGILLFSGWEGWSAVLLSDAEEGEGAFARTAEFLGTQGELGPALFVLWSLYVVAGLFLSRKHLVN